MYQVENFKYNGFMIKPEKGIANYTATFKNWTNDPGIVNCLCSDGKERLIPSCCLIGDKSNLPSQDMSNKVIFGVISKS
jgi:hypothetical protein